VRKKIIITLAFLAFVLSTDNLKAVDYAEFGKDSSADAIYAAGMINGLSWSKTILGKKAISQALPPKAIEGNMIAYVYSKCDNMDAKLVGPIMADLYKDPANGQLHPSLVFFTAAAKLLGFPESGIEKSLGVMRSGSQYPSH